MSERDRRISDQLVRLVQILFALVVGQSLLLYRDIVVDPLREEHRVATLALIGVYATTIFSWIDWNVTMEYRPYNRNPYNKHRTTELARLWFDLFVVTTYAYLLFTVQAFAAQPRGNLTKHLFGYPMVFGLYLLSGVLRRMAYGRWASHIASIVLFGAVYTAIACAYYLVTRALNPNFDMLWVNVTALVLVLSTMVGYRFFRAWRTRIRRSRKDDGLTVGVDVDGVLGNQIRDVLPRVQQKLGVSLTYEEITDWELPIGDSDIAKEIVAAMEDPKYILEMPAHQGGRALLESLYPSNTIKIITARPNGTKDWTQQWLENNSLPYDDVLNVTEGKKSLFGLDILVDDYVGNIVPFLDQSNGHAILIDQPWNQDRQILKKWLDQGRLTIVENLSGAGPVVRRLRDRLNETGTADQQMGESSRPSKDHVPSGRRPQ